MLKERSWRQLMAVGLVDHSVEAVSVLLIVGDDLEKKESAEDCAELAIVIGMQTNFSPCWVTDQSAKVGLLVLSDDL